MSEADNLHQRLNRTSEIRLSVKARKSRRDIPRPVWFVHEGGTVYLLPNYGSDINWYKNFLADQTLKISVSGGGGEEEEEEISAKGKHVTDSNRVNEIFRKFDSKYGGVKQYYPKVDVAVEVPIL
jgi:hypothetical protein